MDLPPEYHSYSAYNSTSAHKLNHSFKPNCAWQHGANLLHHQTKGNFKICSKYLVYLPRQVTVCAVCRHTHTRSRGTQARLVAVG